MTITVTEVDGLRLLQFGTPWCQGAMRIGAPDQLELAYAVRMFGWMPFHDLDTLAGRHLVTLGLGAGSLTKFAHRVLGMRTTAVEIDAAVIQACREHFELPRDGERLRVVHADAGEFIADGAGPDIDVLQVDAYDAEVRQPALDTPAFYAACRARMRAGGTVAVNLVGDRLDVRASVGRIRDHLRPKAIWQFPPTEAGNVVVIAPLAEPPAEALLASRAAEAGQRWGLPASAWLAMVRRSNGSP